MQINKNLLIFCFILIGYYANGQHKISHTITREEIEKCETGKGHCYLVSINRKAMEDSLLITFPDNGGMSQIYLYTDSSFIKLTESNIEQSVFIRQSQKAQNDGFQEIDMTGLSDGMYKAYMHPSDHEKAIGISIYTRKTDCLPQIDTIDGQRVLAFTGRMPEFKGGQVNMMKYISENIRILPADTIHISTYERFQSRVVISLVIDAEGKVRNPCISRPYHEDRRTFIEEMVLNIINKMPDWEPGMVGDEKVAVRYSIPLNLHIRWEEI